jgi:hypothetical protein
MRVCALAPPAQPNAATASNPPNSARAFMTVSVAAAQCVRDLTAGLADVMVRG